MPYHITEQGRGHVTQSGSSTPASPTSWRLSIPAITPAHRHQYHNAQLSDYDDARHFTMRPPLRLTLRARMASASTTGALHGTAGFGWWNHPFSPAMRWRDIRLPQAVWFFFSGDESHMPLAQGQPANGWKGATFNAQTPLFYALLPFALPGFLVMRVPFLQRRLWGIGQRALGIHEAHRPRTDLTTWHDYQIDWWGEAGADFYVDGECILRAPQAPAKALGFVAWMDNQYAIVTSRGRFGWGIVPQHDGQTLAIEGLTITPLGVSF